MHVFVASSSALRGSVQDLSQKAARFGVPVARTWSEFTAPYVIDRFPEISYALSLQPASRRKDKKRGGKVLKKKPPLQSPCGRSLGFTTHSLKLSLCEAIL